MKHRNWPEICKVKDDLLRLLLATAKDPMILDGLERGFPRLRLFCDTPSVLLVPASALREMAESWANTALDVGPDLVLWHRHMSWYQIREQFCIPHAMRWITDRIPAEVLGQLVGDVIGSGMKLKYRGQECLVTGLSAVGELGEVFTKDMHPTFLELVPAKFVALDK
ncbi:hypothetical protein KW786_02440 [Candidatus Parcubacteria bacterium]|nr:hypothetical protein [Candidatus Parcubacteria bacterium]